jgi:hypothetical protein
MGTVGTDDTTPRYLDTLFGETPSWVYAASGTPVLLDNGKVDHTGFTQDPYNWPADRDKILDHLAAPSATGRDVWITPGMAGGASTPDSRRKQLRKPLPSPYLWGDVDTVTEQSRARADRLVDRGGMIVNSGHGLHVYTQLAEPVADVEPWNRRLCQHLQGDPSPSWHGGYLRPAGTLNHKDVPTGGQPLPVTIIRRVEGDGWTLDELEDLLPPDRPPADTDSTVPPPEDIVQPDYIPGRLRRLMAEPCEVGSRSGRFHAIVGACKAAGMTKGETCYVMSGWQPGVNKYGHRVNAEVARSYGKVDGPPETPAGDQATMLPPPSNPMAVARTVLQDRHHPNRKPRSTLSWPCTTWYPRSPRSSGTAATKGRCSR